MQLTLVTTRCSMWICKIIHGISLNLPIASIAKKPVASICLRFGGHTVSSAQVVAILLHGRQKDRNIVAVRAICKRRLLPARFFIERVNLFAYGF